MAYQQQGYAQGGQPGYQQGPAPPLDTITLNLLLPGLLKSIILHCTLLEKIIFFPRIPRTHR